MLDTKIYTIDEMIERTALEFKTGLFTGITTTTAIIAFIYLVIYRLTN